MSNMVNFMLQTFYHNNKKKRVVHFGSLNLGTHEFPTAESTCPSILAQAYCSVTSTGNQGGVGVFLATEGDRQLKEFA